MSDTSIDIIAQAVGKAWAQVERKKQADLLPGIQLQEHQQRIADRVAGSNPRMLVYHGLGSGKSLSALAAAEAAQKLDGGSYGIVAPASLKNNFQKEIKKFTSAAPGSTPEVMSYTGLGMGKQFQDRPETLIMDEAARLRNPDSAMTQAAVRAAAQAKRVMLLTGTPITNEPKDLASLISLLHGKQLSPEEFDKQYVGEETVKPNWSGWFQGAQPGVRPIMKNGPALRKLLEGHVDYQPSKTPEGVNVNEQTIRVPLSSEQDKIQKAIRTKVPPGFLWKMDHEFPLSREELSKLNSFMTGFRQVGLSTQPFRADRSPLRAFQQSAKMQEAFKNLKTTLDSDPRKKAIIYSNFVNAGLNPYSAGLTQAGISHGMFTGKESVKARQDAINAYNENKLRALLVGPAGAEGISTKGTSLIQLMDPHWNEARSQQAQGRGLRFDSHTDLPEELKNVAVQRYLSSSEDPSYIGKLMGYQRERTGDEVLSRLTAEKERLNEQFRQILRDAGTKTAESLTPGLAKIMPAASPSPANPFIPKTDFTNQYAPKTITPPTSSQGPIAPITPQLSDAFPTRNAWTKWLGRNYVPGNSRIEAIDLVNENLNGNQAQPNARATYTNILDNRFANAQRQARQPFSVADPDKITDDLPLSRSGVELRSRKNPYADPTEQPDNRPLLVVGGKEQFMGQSLPRSHQMHMPAMTRGLVGLHEMEHINQALSTNIDRHARTAQAEPAAVLNEITQGVDAATQATGQPVSGDMALTPKYKPKLDWMRQQALQHQLENVSDRQHGKTMTELLNTPEGQAWQRMQLQQLVSREKQNALADPIRGAISEWYKSSAAANVNGLKILPRSRRKRKPAPVTNNALAGAIGAGAAAFPLMSLHGDAFGTYNTIKARVNDIPKDNLYFPEEFAAAQKAQAGDVMTYFGKPQGWFDDDKNPNLSKLTQGGEWTSGTGTYHGGLLRPRLNAITGLPDVQILEGGDSFPHYRRYPPVINGQYASPFQQFVEKQDVIDAAAGKMPQSDVGLYGRIKGSPQYNKHLQDFEHSTSTNPVNRFYNAFTSATAKDQTGAAKDMTFFQRLSHYSKNYERQGKLLKQFRQQMTPEQGAGVWENISQRDSHPMLITRTPQIDSLLNNPKNAPGVADSARAAIDTAFDKHYPYRPYNLFGAVSSGLRRLLLPQTGATERTLTTTNSPVPPLPAPRCTEDYCVTPAAKLMQHLGVPIGVRPGLALPADLGANSGSQTVGMVIPTPGQTETTEYGFIRDPKDTRYPDYANPANEQLFKKWKDDYRNKIHQQWLPQSRNRRIAAGLLAATAVGAAGYGTTKLVQNFMARRQEAARVEKAKIDAAKRRKLLQKMRRQLPVAAQKAAVSRFPA